MVPTGGPTYALVALSTAATIIASQALITGVFSLTHQAMLLGYFPRVTVTHTSRETEGQIYVPEMNWALCVACITLVLTFRESSRLAAAYGIAVSGTMGITSFVYFVVTRRTWGWPLWKALPPLVLFLSFDLPFFGANLLKFMDGGYIPIAVGAAVFVVMVDWRVGRSVLAARLTQLAAADPRFPGDARFERHRAPPGHRDLPLVEPRQHPARPDDARAPRPRAARAHRPLDRRHRARSLRPAAGARLDRGSRQRRDPRHHPHGLHGDAARAGHPRRAKLPVDLADATYFLGRETFVAGKGGKMGVVSEGLFAFLSRNAKSPTSWFSIPPDQVVEVGMQMDL